MQKLLFGEDTQVVLVCCFFVTPESNKGPLWKYKLDRLASKKKELTVSLLINVAPKDRKV